MTPETPNTYPFSTTYEEMLSDLQSKDLLFYTENGLIQMLERNRHIKERPQRFVEERALQFDVIFTCEEKCFESVCQGSLLLRLTLVELLDRGCRGTRTVLIVNFEIKDNHEEAAAGALHILRLAKQLQGLPDLPQQCESLLENFQETCPLPLLHSVSFY